jgi:hypothetical protein
VIRLRREALIAAIALIGVCSTIRNAHSGPQFEVSILSSRADTVSGGDVLVQVKTPKSSHWIAKLDGLDVTSSFHPAQGSDRSIALLTGLKVGTNRLEIRVNGAIRSGLEILNHPLSGPVFSGPHKMPFICQTADHGLGPALDTNCDAKTVVQYYYKSTQSVQPSGSVQAASSAQSVVFPSGFKAYDTARPAPLDVAKTVTTDGRTVDYIVRREIGVINRAVYYIEFLHNPGQPLPNPWTGPTPGWNGRLVYGFGGGCGAGYSQGTLWALPGDIPFLISEDPPLAQGYAFATSTLNVLGNECDDKVGAETLSMVKEHFIKNFGEPTHTIGLGGSGGAIEQQLAAQNYPGLLDGIVAGGSFPDIVTNIAATATDCTELRRAFEMAKQPWTEAQKTAVSGFATWRACLYEAALPLHFIDPKTCDHQTPNDSLPKKMIYDPTGNPTGARCDIYDNEINVFGRDPQTGFALRTLDNIGVQYGLVAFNRGEIDAEQFIELNEHIGGIDQDGNPTAARTESDPEVLRRAYQSGVVLTGGGGLNRVPILDVRLYLDDQVGGHDKVESLITRARLIAANGNADNQVVLELPRVELLSGLPEFARVPKRTLIYPVREMDRWLDNIAADRAEGPLSAKVLRDKPTDLLDSCWSIDGERIVERATYDGPGRCNQMYPSHGDPRLASGAPLTDDILKCALKPISAVEYAQPLTARQLDRLRAIFPSGVCDYRQPGVGQQRSLSTWQRF